MRRLFLLSMGAVLAGAAAYSIPQIVTTVADLNHLRSSVAAISADASSKDIDAVPRDLHTLERDLSRTSEDAETPSWRVAEVIPFLGPNLTAIRLGIDNADALATTVIRPLAAQPVLRAPQQLLAGNGAVNLGALERLEPALRRADTRAASIARRTASIGRSGTLGPVQTLIAKLATETKAVSSALHTADVSVRLLPRALGSGSERHYLVIMQNNAELRSTGGVPSALMLLSAANGTLSISAQASAADLPGSSSPVLPLDPATRALFGAIPGEYIQDVNLTPDFPTSARLAAAMWEQRYGGHIDGVISVDPIALSYVLGAIGPVQLDDGQRLTSSNAVSTLLSGTYRRYPNPADQDWFFASVTRSVFGRLISSRDHVPAEFLAMAKGFSDRRILVASLHSGEQTALQGAHLTGQLPESNAASTVSGAFLNDATGAKMDYYLRAHFSGQATCPVGDRIRYALTVTLHSTAPASASSLPEYVTGGGEHGVLPGRVRTLVQVYGPVGATVLGVSVDGKRVGDGSDIASNRPVVTVPIELGPGQRGRVTISLLGDEKKAGPLALWITPGVDSSASKPLQAVC